MFTVAIDDEVNRKLKEISYIIGHIILKDNHSMKQKYIGDDITQAHACHLAIYLFTIENFTKLHFDKLPMSKIHSSYGSKPSYGDFTGNRDTLLTIANSFIRYFKNEEGWVKTVIEVSSQNFIKNLDDCHGIKLHGRKDFHDLIAILRPTSIQLLVESFTQDFNRTDRKLQIKFVKRYLNVAKKVKKFEEDYLLQKNSSNSKDFLVNLFDNGYYSNREVFEYHNYVNIFLYWDPNNPKIVSRQIQKTVDFYEVRRTESIFNHSYDYVTFMLEENNIKGEKIDQLLHYMIKNHEFSQLESFSDFCDSINKSIPLEWAVYISGVHKAPPPF